MLPCQLLVWGDLLLKLIRKERVLPGPGLAGRGRVRQRRRVTVGVLGVACLLSLSLEQETSQLCLH